MCSMWHTLPLNLMLFSSSQSLVVPPLCSRGIFDVLISHVHVSSPQKSQYPGGCLLWMNTVSFSPGSPNSSLQIILSSFLHLLLIGSFSLDSAIVLFCPLPSVSAVFLSSSVWSCPYLCSNVCCVSLCGFTFPCSLMSFNPRVCWDHINLSRSPIIWILFVSSLFKCLSCSLGVMLLNSPPSLHPAPGLLALLWCVSVDGI